MLKNTHEHHQQVATHERLSSFRVAAIQMASGPSVSANLEEAARWIEEAVTQQAQLVVLPEYFCIMGMKDTDKKGNCPPGYTKVAAAVNPSPIEVSRKKKKRIISYTKQKRQF